MSFASTSTKRSKKNDDDELGSNIASVSSSLSTFINNFGAARGQAQQPQPKLKHESLYLELDQILQPVPFLELLKFHMEMVERATELANKYRQ